MPLAFITWKCFYMKWIFRVDLWVLLFLFPDFSISQVFPILLSDFLSFILLVASFLFHSLISSLIISSSRNTLKPILDMHKEISSIFSGDLERAVFWIVSNAYFTCEIFPYLDLLVINWPWLWTCWNDGWKIGQVRECSEGIDFSHQ